jgi:hypothetical protein
MIHAHYSSYRLDQVIQTEKLKEDRNKKLNKNLLSVTQSLLSIMYQKKCWFCRDKELDKTVEFEV